MSIAFDLLCFTVSVRIPLAHLLSNYIQPPSHLTSIKTLIWKMISAWEPPLLRNLVTIPTREQPSQAISPSPPILAAPQCTFLPKTIPATETNTSPSQGILTPLMPLAEHAISLMKLPKHCQRMPITPPSSSQMAL